MPDITLCKNEKCSKKDSCHRYVAKPNEYWQSYFIGMKEGDCKYYWRIEK
jgi:hypothetical protein